MGNIFICYRREDSQSITDRIFDHLIRYFSRKSLFKDVDNIPPGVDFRTHIDDAVRQSKVMLVIIGRGWLSAKDATANQRRLDDPDDFVRVEISSALQLKRSIVPVLVDGARMPTVDELPPALKHLAFINAVQVRSDPDFTGDFTRLRRALEPIAGRWLSGWITSMAIAAAVLGVVVAIVWYAVGPLGPLDPSIITSPITPWWRPDIARPTAPSPANDCVDVPFNDTTKIPPVTTTKRICG
jgi:TIR domain